MALIVKYKFQNVDANGNSVTLLPQFPSGVSYTKTDVVEGNITTRVIETDDLSKVTYIRFGCNESTYVVGAWEYLTEILDINISYVNTFNRMFRGCKLLNKIDISNWNTSKVTSMSYMFNTCSQLTQLDVSGWNTSNVTDMSGMFHTCSKLTQLDVSKWDTSKVTNMNSMFRGCPKLAHLDVSNWDTKNVKNISVMFNNCSSLTSLDVSNWDTSNVTSMYTTFGNCNQLAQLDVSNWDTKNVTDMSELFRKCSQFTQLDLSNFDTKNVTSMAYMFEGCSQLTQLDVSNFDTSKVTNMQSMFSSCKVKNVGLIYCSEDTINKLANCITSPCNFYVTNKTYTSPNSLVKYVMYREDKKRIVYYDQETQTWEKPILREWDSIEKHSDGKYYYHKRCGEVVFDGSEEWVLDSTQENTCRYRVRNENIKNSAKLIADRFMFRGNLAHGDYEYIFMNDAKNLYININKSKLSSQNAQGFKTWLQANPTTVVYELAEEKVYECADLDLITYPNETNLMVKGGAIVPKTTLKIHQNIANITTVLQEKVGILENDTNTINSNINTINTEIDNINTDLIGVSESIEGSLIFDSKDGYLKDIEILGNTIQNQDNLADIRSVGDKLENQELYEIPVLIRGKNLFDGKWIDKTVLNLDKTSTLFGKPQVSTDYSTTENFIPVRPNTTYYVNSHTNQIWVVYYDRNKTPISHSQVWTTLSIGDDIFYIRFYDLTSRINNNPPYTISIAKKEEYEPYQGQQITILSPVQLEKVGDVADRIIEKDGVWGVEKNIGTIVLDGTMIQTSDIYNGFNLHVLTLNNMSTTLSDAKINLISDVGNVISYNNRFVDMKEGNIYATPSSKKIYFTTAKEVGIFNAELKDKNIKYILGTPTFIPLPHDQQIKLRTFANKTNISFGCEIEPTLKASVPKSLGASVSSHSEQIDNLSKEIDKVKKLEESTVSTVTTESGFTTVEETSNGYFEDVKLDGRTLVNLFGVKTVDSSKNIISVGLIQNLKANTDYTLIFDTTSCATSTTRACFIFNLESGNTHYLQSVGNWEPSVKLGKYIYKLNFKDNVKSVNLWWNGVDGTVIYDNIILLEGDHTQNPPEFFEGLKSVGDGADEISVLSSNENLLNLTGGFDVIPRDTNISTVRIDNDSIIIKSSDWIDYYGHKINVKKGKLYYSFDLTYSVLVYITNSNGEVLKQIVNDNKTEFRTLKGSLEIEKDCELTFTYRYRAADNSEGIVRKAHVSQSIQNYKLSKQDKKRILYYNDETQSWEKPILRQWDSIEKHSDGKYYYHKRSGEVVFNGEEQYDWQYYSYGGFGTNIPNLKRNTNGSEITSYSISNSLTPIAYNELPSAHTGCYSVHFTVSAIVIKSNYTTVDEFKVWLKSNPVIIVYQLAQEQVYECTNLDLITYSGETNLVVKSGVLNPKVTLKIHQNITNIITILQKKVSVLENVFIQGLKQVLAGDMQSLAYMLYPEDFENIEQSIDETSLGEQQDDPTDE